MKEIIIYLLKASLCLSVFWAAYRFYLRKESFFLFNRVFLISGLVMSFVLPLIRLTYTVQIPYTRMPLYSNADAVYADAGALGGNLHTAGNWLWLSMIVLYVCGLMFFLLRNIIICRKVSLIVRTGSSRRREECIVVDNEDIESPFTVANYVFMNSKNISGSERNVILNHELCHLRQKHWIDILLGETMLVLQWFNPLAWKYISAIRENHEFLADKAVVDSGVDPVLYSQVLVNQTFRTPIFNFSAFSNKNNSKRLAMLKKQKSMNWKKAAILALIPLFALFLKANAVPKYEYVMIDPSPVPAGLTLPDVTEQSRQTDQRNTSGITVVGADKDVDTIKVYSSNGETRLKVYSSNGETRFFFKNSGNVTQIGDAGDYPLFVIDGKKATKEEFAKINSSDIDNIVVLKNAAATKEYGDEGKNGVLIVTLKGGKNNQSNTAETAVTGTDTRSESERDIVREDYIIKNNPAVKTTGDGNNPEPTTVSLASTALMNNVAGLNINQNGGQPDSTGLSNVIRIRFTTGDPLFIIDGVESDKETFANLNYYDIVNVTVLKDAAAGLYGSKGVNGVLIVTTKKGRSDEQSADKPTVSIFSQYGWSEQKPYFPTPADADEYARAKPTLRD